MADSEKDSQSKLSKWRQLPKMSFNSRDLSRRMKKVEGATVKHARRFVFRRIDNIREVRRHIALWVLAIGVIIGASGLQLLWYQQSYRAIANANDGTYAEAVLGPVNTLNPLFAQTSAEESVGRLLFSRLINYDTTGHLNYDLAESMSISDDRRTYTVKIRHDARWQDGIYVRARDVVYTVNLLKNPATRSTITGWNDIVATEVADDPDGRTVAFQLPATYAAFPHALTFLPILPEHILRSVEPSAIRENAFSKNPVANGPFTLRFIQEVDPASGRKIIHLARNDGYYRGAPKLERFQLHVYGSSEGIKRAIGTAEVNAATDLTVTDAVALTSDRYSAVERPINAGVYAILNTTSPVLKDKPVRQALQLGTNTQAVRDAITKNLPDLYLPFVSGQLFGDVPVKPAYDPARAAQLLNDAGWVLDGTVRKKDGQPLTLSVVTTKSSDFETALNVLVNQWRELGVTVTTTIVDPTDPTQNVSQDYLQKRNYDVLLYQLTIGGDPDIFAYWHSSQVSGGFNFSNYSNGISDEALLSARSRIEPDLRNVKYLNFARQWLSDVPAIGLYQATSQYVYSKSVHATASNAVLMSAGDRYADVLYWAIGDRLVHRTP